MSKNSSNDSKSSDKHIKKEGKAHDKASSANSKRPVLKFGLTIGVLMGLFYAFNLFAPAESTKRVFTSYQHLNAGISGAVLGLIGHDVKVTGETISSKDFSVNIRHGCDAIEPTALFVFAILAFPAAFLKKLPGIIAGVLFLAALNIVRIVSLFLTGVYYPEAFHTMHVDVWQAIFIFFAIVFWILWALWSGKTKVRN